MNQPLSLIDFGPKWIRRGALLLAGSTDNEIVSDLPHHGLEDHIYLPRRRMGIQGI